MQLRSLAFADGDLIPLKYTCEGTSMSPPLLWTSPPEGTKSFALLCEDPDASSRPFVHWLVYNIQPDFRDLPEQIPAQKNLPTGAMQGVNDFEHLGYGGPCPPSGTHRYVFRLFALDSALPLEAGTTKDKLLQAMDGHVLEQAQLVGRYKKIQRVAAS